MDAEEFRRLASGISSDPWSRVPEHIKPFLSNYTSVIDCHCHIFNETTVPKALLNLRMPYTRKLALSIARTLHFLNPRSNDDWGSRNAYFIELFNKSTREITDKLLSYYPQDAILTPLMMDMHNRADRNQRFNAEHYIIEQTNEIRNLLTQGYLLLPFFPADPTFTEEKTGSNIFDLVYKAFTGGYGFIPFGLKVYPTLGYLPGHPLLMEIYRFAEEKNIPVTAHCSRGVVHAYFRRIRNIEGYKIGPDGRETYAPESRTFISGDSFARYFNHPKNWEAVLEKFPRLRLNLAHFGGFEQWYRFSKGENNTWPSRIMDFMHRYPNVYADLSFSNVYPVAYNIMRDRLEHDDVVRSRVLYGYDYYMCVVRGHFRSLRRDFESAMGNNIIREISIDNTRKFLV